MIEAVLATPLDESGMRLDQVTRSHRLDELEFYYPVNELADRHVREILSRMRLSDEIRERIGDLTFSTTHGYMRGFIDLVFETADAYLADYKSNWLGATVNAYQQPPLTRAMAREAYYLQYLVYCVALHRYLWVGACAAIAMMRTSGACVICLSAACGRTWVQRAACMQTGRPKVSFTPWMSTLSSGMRLPARPGKPVQGRLDL